MCEKDKYGENIIYLWTVKIMCINDDKSLRNKKIKRLYLQSVGKKMKRTSTSVVTEVYFALKMQTNDRINT